MSRFDDDTSTIRLPVAGTPIDLSEPEDDPPYRTRTPGIITGALLGAVLWAVIIALGLAAWRWIFG